MSERSSILLNGAPTDTFPIEKGVRQGAVSSPILFNLVPNELAVQLADVDAGIQLADQYRKVNCLLYADDIALIARNQDEMQLLCDHVTQWAD